MTALVDKWQVVIHTYKELESGLLDDEYEIIETDVTQEQAEGRVRDLRRKYPRCGAFARPVGG